jgi:oligopeptidase A
LDATVERIEAYVSQDRGRLDFSSVVLGLDETTRALNESWVLVGHLDSLCNSPELRKPYNEMLPKVTAFFAKIYLNSDIWDLLVTYSQTENARQLNEVEKRALHETMEHFRQQGAELSGEKKAQLEEIENQLSQVTQKYSENVLDSTNAWELIVCEAEKLKGLPESALEAARQDALARGHGSEEAPCYRLTLKVPSMIPVLEYVEDEEIREKVWRASTQIGRGGEHDNTDLVWEILKLRQQKAALLGRENFADLVLQQRMAKSGRTALAFVEDLHHQVKAAFDLETIRLQEFRADVEHRAADLMEPWQVAFWAEKQRRAEYDFDPEELRPWFAIDEVLSGMFRIAETIFDLKISRRETVYLGPDAEPVEVSVDPHQPGPVEVWHPDVKFYEVRNGGGTHIGSFYADWHPRDSKRSGAWMNYLKMGQPPSRGKERQLHLGLICGNMTPSLEGRPALLTHDEVCTVFHEFGHLLHQLLGNVDIPSLNGVSVYWDFVELPSQLMENFCWERTALDLFAKHHETGEPIPPRLFKKMIAARNFRGASAMMRQLSLAKLDLELHLKPGLAGGQDLDAIARELLDGYLMPLKTEPPSILRRFGHLFSNPVGYAAGYYSYKWAEVLDADAFTRFQQEGVLNPEVGRAFRDCILSKGNSRDPAGLFRDFMGRDPDPRALLVRSGLV